VPERRLDPVFPMNILPSHYLTVHQSAIRALAWVRAPPSWPSGATRLDGDPTVIVSGGYDGLECLTDIREGHGSVMNRTRGISISLPLIVTVIIQKIRRDQCHDLLSIRRRADNH
jgi:hypothetical protein